MKLAIIGSRTLKDYDWFKEQVYNHFFHQSPDGDGGCLEWWGMNEVISGGAVGADQFSVRLVREWNKQVGHEEIKMTEHLPNWDLYGKRAGFVRNELIIKDADMVLAFWDGASKGTGNSLSIAKRLKKDHVDHLHINESRPTMRGFPHVYSYHLSISISNLLSRRFRGR